MSHAHFFGATRWPFGLIVGTDDEVKADRNDSDAIAPGAIAKSSTYYGKCMCAYVYTYVCM